MELTSKLLVYKQRLLRESQDNSTIEVSSMVASKTVPHLSQSSNTNRGRGTINLGNNCQICHKDGHMASKCFWRFENGENRGRGQQNYGGNCGSRGSFRGGRTFRGGNGNIGGRNNSFGGSYTYGDINGYGGHVASFPTTNWQPSYDSSSDVSWIHPIHLQTSFLIQG